VQWRIRVHDSSSVLYETTVPQHHIRERDLHELLRALVVKYSLTERDGIEECYLSRRAPWPRSPLLEVRRDHGSKRALFMCGVNPHAEAALMDDPAE